MFIFGQNVMPGVVGSNPSIPVNATVNDNIPFQYDFRSVYASVLQKWFCVDSSNLQSILYKNFQSMNIVKSVGCNNTGPQPADVSIISVYPNPFANMDVVRIQYHTNGGHTMIQVIDTLGRVISTLVDAQLTAGTYTQNFKSQGLPSGVYYIRLQNESEQDVKSIVKVQH